MQSTDESRADILKNHPGLACKLPSVRGFAYLSIALLGLSVLETSPLQASHFRFAQVTWRRVTGPDVPENTVEFTSLQAWRADADETLPIDFGDGTSGIGDATEVSTGSDSAGQPFIVNRYTIQHTYDSEGPFIALLEGCCRISDLVNAPDAGERIETVVDLRNGNLGSPVSSIPVILEMSQGRRNALILPAVDPDGDPVTCRLATFAESQIPDLAEAGGHVLTVSDQCVLEWNTAGTTVGEQYAVQVMLEENHAGNTSRAALDFLIEIVEGSENAPECSGKEGVQVIQIGQQFAADFVGTDVDGDDLTFMALGVPPGATVLPPAGTTQAQPLVVTFEWTPTPADDKTSHAVTLIYRDTFGRETSCILALQVESPNSPPDCSQATASQEVLWPPNHKFNLLSILGVTDPDGDPVSITITAITQDEPVQAEGHGSGKTCPDGVLVDVDGDGSPELSGVRAERAGGWGHDGRYEGSHRDLKKGRVYAISFIAKDGRGGECDGSVRVSVPHRRDGVAIDDGQLFDSTVCVEGDDDDDDKDENDEHHDENDDHPQDHDTRGAAKDPPPVYSWDDFTRLTPEPLFIRGDSNWDEEVDLSDALMILQRLFSWVQPHGSGSFDCPDAADVNDDDNVNMADAVQICAYLFLGTFTPPPPVLSIGADPTPGSLPACE